MKTRIHAKIITAAAAVLLATSCRIDQSVPQDRTTTNPSDTSTAAAVTISADSMFAALRPLQAAVYLAPADVPARAALATFAFDSASGSFYVVGKGVQNSTAAAGTAEQGQVRAAESDARRWALYLRAWTSGDTRTFGAQIEGEITYSTVLKQLVEGDTLYVLMQVPYGSVAVK